ncbi:MAG: tetratricopeptide repeat protein [Phycisphaerales bacterium]
MRNIPVRKTTTRSFGLAFGLCIAALGTSCATTDQNPWLGTGYVDTVASEQHLADARRAELDGDLDSMAASLEAAIRSNPYDGRPHYNLGVIELRAGRLQAAAERFDQASRLMPEKAEPLVGLGAVWLQAKRLEEASEAFRRAIEIDPTSPRARAGLVMAMEYAPGVDESMQHLSGQRAPHQIP